MKKYIKGGLKFISLVIIVLGIAFILINKIKAEDEQARTFPHLLKKDGCLGLTYHRVRSDNILTKVIDHLTDSDELKQYSVYTSQFKQHVEFLRKQGATFVTPDELRKFHETGEYPKKCVWISFDDIDESVYKNAFPILKKYKIPFTIFIIVGQVGNSDFDNLSLATWTEIKDMVNSGLVTVGSHSYNMHYLKGDYPIFWPSKEKGDFLKDLIKSKKVIETKLKGVKVEDFAYPYGDGKSELVPIIKKAGFSSAYILAPEIIYKENDLYWQNRIVVNDVVFKNTVEPWIKHK